MKPGYLTSEFWTTLLLHAVTVLFATHAVPVDNPWTQMVAIVCSAVAQIIYTQSRNTLKQTHAEVDPGLPGPTPFDPTAKPTGTANTGLGALSVTLLLIALSGVLGNLAGCAQNETNRAAQGMILTQTHAKNVDDLINAHPPAISASEARTMQAMIHAEQAAVNAYYAAIDKGDSNALATAKAALAAATGQLTAELAKFPKPTPITLPPLTQPAPAIPLPTASTMPAASP